MSGIKNVNLATDAKVRHAKVRIDIDSASPGVAAYDTLRDIKIRDVTFVYAVASDTGTHANVQVGVSGALTRYVDAATEDSKAQGDVTSPTVSNTGTLVDAGTALLVTQASGTPTNTGEVDVVIEYELVDRALA